MSINEQESSVTELDVRSDMEFDEVSEINVNKCPENKLGHYTTIITKSKKDKKAEKM